MKKHENMRHYGISSDSVTTYHALSSAAIGEVSSMRERDADAPIGIRVPIGSEIGDIRRALGYLDVIPYDICLRMPEEVMDARRIDAVSRVAEEGMVDEVAFTPGSIADWSAFAGAPFTPCVENAQYDGVSAILDGNADVGLVLHLGAAYLVDPSMRYGYDLVRRHGDRIRKVVVSGVVNGRYGTFLEMGDRDRNRLLRPLARISPDVPVILSSPVSSVSELLWEMQKASELVPSYRVS